MYIAHHLITIDTVFQQRLPPPAGHPPGVGVPPVVGDPGVPPGRPQPDSSGQLMDVVSRVKRLGNDNFTYHVALQKQQLSDRLRAAKGHLTLIPITIRANRGLI